MNIFSIRKGLLRAACLSTAAAYVGAVAIVPGTLTSAWPWVGKIGGTTQYYGSGIAIGDHWILTARHLVNGLTNNALFQLDSGQTYTSLNVFVHPTDDIALVKVAETFPGWYDPSWSTAEVGTTVKMVGFGYTGVFGGGVWTLSGTYGTMREGQNMVSFTQYVDFGDGTRGDWMVYDFDGPVTDFLGDGFPVTNECTFAGGDSGGPSFVNQAGIWKVSGVHSWVGNFGGGPAFPQYGSALGDLRVSTYKTWYESVFPAEVFATGLTMFRGSTISGTVANTQRPEDSYLVVRPGVVFSNSEAPVQAILTGTSPVATTTELHFCLECKASAPVISQKVELMNFSTGLYELVDARPATTTDSLYEFTDTSAPSRFIEAGTRAVQARISFKATGPVFAYPWFVGIDRAVWNIKR